MDGYNSYDTYNPYAHISSNSCAMMPVNNFPQQASNAFAPSEPFQMQTMPIEPVSPFQMQPEGNTAPYAVTDFDESFFPPDTMQAGMIPEAIPQDLYTPDFLRGHLGELMRVEFLIGNNTHDRTGYLREVGASYIVLDSMDGSSSVMCDLDSLRFATILRSNAPQGINSIYPE